MLLQNEWFGSGLDYYKIIKERKKQLKRFLSARFTMHFITKVMVFNRRGTFTSRKTVSSIKSEKLAECNFKVFYENNYI